MKYDIKVAQDAVVRVEANDLEEAIVKAQEVYKTQKASKNYDEINFDYKTGLKNKKMRALLGLGEKRVGGREIEKEQVLLNYVGPEGFTYNTKMDLALTPKGQNLLVEKGLFDEKDLTDKNLVIDESGFTSGDFADLSGVAGPIFGAIAAMSPHLRAVNLLGRLVGPRFGRMLAAGAGTAIGKSAEEAYETAEGIQKQDADELADLFTTEFAIGSGGQALGELVGLGYAAFFGKKAALDTIRDSYVISKGYDMNDVLKLDEKLGRLATEKDIEKAFRAGEIKDLGVQGAVSMALLGKAIPGRTQAMGETIAGRQARERGLIDYNNAMKGQLYKLLNEKRNALKEYSDFQGTNAAASEVALKKSQLQKAEDNVTNHLNKIFKDLSEQTGGFNSSIMGAPSQAALGLSVQKTIRDSYRTMIDNFRFDYDKAFSKVRNLSDELEIPDAEIKINLKNLQNLIDNKLKTTNPTMKYREDQISIGILQGISKEIEKGVFKDGATLSQMIEMRSDLIDATLFGGLRQSKSGQFVNDVIKEVDSLISKAPDNLLITVKSADDKIVLSPDQKKSLSQIIKDLKDTNKKYFEDMKPFNDAITQRIISDSSTFGTNADDIYKHIILKNNAGAINTILQAMERGGARVFRTGFDKKTEKETFTELVGPGLNINKKVAADQLRIDLTRRIFADAVEAATDPVTSVFNPSKYVNYIKGYGATLRPLLKDQYENMMQTLDSFNAYSPKLNPREVTQLVERLRLEGPEVSGNIVSSNMKTLADALEAKAKASDSLLKIEQSKVLQNIQNSTPETITQMVFRPNSAAAINQVRNEISEEAFLNIQDEALEQLIQKSISPGGTDITDLFKPGNFQRALSSYGDETLEAMFGKELSSALKGYGRAIDRTLAGAEKQGAGGIVAATLAAGFFNLNILPTVVALSVAKTVFSQPKIVSLMARTDKSAMGEVLDAFEKAIRLAGVRGLVGTSEGAITQTSEELQKQNITGDNFLDQAREVINQVAVPAKVELDLPDINLSQAPTGARTRIGPTLLPNPRDQEIAELLS